MGIYTKPQSDQSVYLENNTNSVRDSVQLFPRYVPIDFQLAVAGTAEDIWLVNTDEATRNVITNPSMETADPPTGYTAVGSVISRQAAQFRSGANSLRSVVNNAAAGEGFYWELATNPPFARHPEEQLTFSVYLRGNAGGETVRLRFWDSTNGFVATSRVLTLDLTWQRLSIGYRPTDSGLTTRLYVVTDVQQVATFFADDAQLEVQQAATTYCDGAQGLLYAWEGTAHASTSVRRHPTVEVREWDLYFSLDTWVALDRSAATAANRFRINAGATWSPDHPYSLQNNFSVLNVNAGERPSVYGVLFGVVRSGSE
mgnify:CR=1 FL=1